jgi:integrase
MRAQPLSGCEKLKSAMVRFRRGPIFMGQRGERLMGPRHWFEDQKSRSSELHLARPAPHVCILAMADVDIRTVAELMGHKSIQMIMGYACLAPEHKLVAVERLAGYTS